MRNLRIEESSGNDAKQQKTQNEKNPQKKNLTLCSILKSM